MRVVFVAALLCACGDDSGKSSGTDAGPDAAPMATGHTAKGVHSGAKQLAAAEADDAALLQIKGQNVNGAGEVDPALATAFWQFSFVSPTAGKRIDVLWTSDKYTVSKRDQIADGLRLVATEWLDSTEAFVKLAANGYEAPSADDQTYSVSLTLAMYTGASEDLKAITEPLWTVNKIHSPPGETPRGEQWLVTYWSDRMGYLICSPDGMCAIDE